MAISAVVYPMMVKSQCFTIWLVKKTYLLHKPYQNLIFPFKMRWNEEILEITVRRTFHRQVGAAQRPRRASISWWCSMGPCPLLRCFKSLGWPWMIPWVIHWENDFLMGENYGKWQEFFKKSWKTHRFLEICSHPSKWQDFFKSLGWLQWMNLKFGSLDGEESIENEETFGLISPIYVILWINIIT